MSNLSDREYVSKQYSSSTNLNSRIDLHKLYSVNPYGWQRWVFDKLELPASGRALELGCGTGPMWAMYPEHIPPGLAMVLTDVSPGMVAAARDNLQTADARSTFCVANAEAIPFADETFDMVIANHMLYHVPDRPHAYAEIARVLKPGGRFHATTIGETHMRELRELLHGYAASYPSKQSTIFTVESGLEELPRYFEGIERARYEDSLEVTEVEPLVQYAASSGELTDEELARLAVDVAQMIAAQGSIHITKDSGIFSAHKG